MKAIVLAGGYATRLWPVTRHRAKPLLPVAGEPIVDRILEPLENEERVSEVYVSTNARFEDDFRDHLDESGYGKATVAVEETRSEDEKFGTIGALAQLVDREEIDDDVLVVAGDNLFSFGIESFIDFYSERDSPTLAAYDVGSYDKAKQYGLVTLEDEKVVGFQEKPDDPESTLVSIACYAFPSDTLHLLSEYLDGDNNPDAPGFFIEWLHTREEVYSYTFDGDWFDVGTPRSYLEANAHLLDGESLVEEGATVEGSQVDGNSYVMSGAEVRDSRLSNTVVFGDATVEGCDVSDSVIDTESVVEDIDFTEALLGEHTRIRGSE